MWIVPWGRVRNKLKRELEMGLPLKLKRHGKGYHKGGEEGLRTLRGESWRRVAGSSSGGCGI